MQNVLLQAQLLVVEWFRISRKTMSQINAGGIEPCDNKQMQCLQSDHMPTVSNQAPCLILEPMAVVAHDLATTLGETLRRPTLVASSQEQAKDLLAELDPGTALHMAIVRMAPGDFADSPLRALIEARSARVILMGSDPAASGGEQRWPWAILEWPFGTGQLLTLLDTLGLLSDNR